MNMRAWMEAWRDAPVKKSMPVLSFPSISLLGVTVQELINDSQLQAKGMKMIADRVDSAAAVSMMDLSVEAEAFGSAIRVSDDEVPTVIGSLVTTEQQARDLAVPTVGAARTGKYIEALRLACEMITDRPVFAGVIGPFSLAGRLMDVSEAMINCYTEPEMVHITMQKTAAFLTEYMKAYKAVGANGVVVAEPLTGLLSPDLAAEFSEPYMKQVIDAVQDDEFIVIYHNCGNKRLDNSMIAIQGQQLLLRYLYCSCAGHGKNQADFERIYQGVLKNDPDAIIAALRENAERALPGILRCLKEKTS